MVKASTGERKIPDSNPACDGIFPGSSHTSDFKIGTQVATLPGAWHYRVGLVGPVSVYCDRVRWKVWSATSISVWQHVQLSEQIRPWDTLACCWEVKQPTNKQSYVKSWLLSFAWYCFTSVNTFHLPWPTSPMKTILLLTDFHVTLTLVLSKQCLLNSTRQI